MRLSRSSRWLLLTLGTVSPLAAQTPADSGAFVIRLGNDTLGMERYVRSGADLRSEIVLRTPSARRVRYVATLGPEGTITRLDLTLEPLGHQHPMAKPARGVMRFHGRTAEVALTIGDSMRRISLPARAGAVPLVAFSHALVEQAILQARRDGRDSVPFDWVALGAPEALPSYVVWCSDDSVRIDFFGDPSYIKVDGGGRIVGLDGRATTQKVMVVRHPAVDLERYAALVTAAETATGPAGQLSPRDTVRAVLDGGALTIDYSRPRKRGREIFGGVVPWNRVWRLGANRATQLSTTVDLESRGRTIPAGSYSLWMLPTPEGATLIVNRQTGQWGTHYDAARDLARLELVRERVTEPLEQLTISVDPARGGGVLRFSWDRTSFLLPFTVKTPRHAAGS